MEFFEAVEKRRTSRSFSMEPLDPATISKLVRAGQKAPTGGNANTRRFLVLDDLVKLTKIRKISPGFIGACPAAIVICTDTSVDQSEYISIFDAGAAAENIALAATALGLGVGFVKSLPEAPVKRVLGLPEHIRLDIIVTLGKTVAGGRPVAKSPRQSVYRNTYGVEYG